MILAEDEFAENCFCWSVEFVISHLDVWCGEIQTLMKKERIGNVFKIAVNGEKS